MAEPITHKFVDVPDEATDPGVKLDASREGVAVVRLSRPERGNALSTTDVAALTEAFTTLQGAEGVRVVFVRGVGGAFSIGGDPAWMRETLAFPEEDNRLYALDLGHMLQALRAIPALTVALVDGPALGIGAGMVAACDGAVATKKALFALPEVKLGLSPGVLAPFVVEAVGARAARRLFATGHAFDAAEALRLKLVDEVVEDAAALDLAELRIAVDILAAAPGAMEASKRLVSHVQAQPLERSVIEDAARRFARQAVADEAREGLKAFLEDRQPNWMTGAPYKP